uniref:cadherin-like domain-containing protein n=1 Tax=Arcobacter sp. TaxID=1872629 RepID=UPI003D0E1ED5
TVTINADGTVKYTPNANFNGTDTFTYTNEEGNTGTVTVTVDAVNDAPVVQNVDLGSTLEDTSITFSKADLLANSSDIDGDELTITNISIDSAYGTIVDNGNGTYTFNPTANYSGDNLEINFTVSDGTTIDSATATINVKAVADLPIVSISINKNIQEEDDDSDSNLDENEIENYHSGDNCGTNLADKMVVDRELVMNEKIDLKEGNDTLILNKDINQVTIDLGEGNDEVIINGKINGTNNFDLGSGDDIIRINDVVTNNTHVLGGDGKDTLYLSGNQSDYIFNWQTNNNGMIEGSITDKIGGGTIQYNQMETLVFSDGSYIGQEPVISKVISENETYTVNISAALVDTDSSETLSVVINGVPTGATLSSDTYTLNDNGNNSWTVTVPAGATSISDSIKMTLPSPTNGFTLDIIARATESHDNADGLNYAEATDSFTKSIIEDPNTENAINKGDGSSSHWDVMETSDHDDVIVAGDNWNKVELEKGNDNLTIGNGDSTNWSSIDADKGNDNIKAGDDWAHIKLGDGNDTLQVGDAYADTDWSRIDAGSGDDIIKAGNNWDIIDGGSGNDTLVLTNEDIDLGNILSNTQIKSIENINLIDGQDQNISINLNDILNIQDNNNELKIFGDDGDKVTLEGEAWEKGTSSEGFTEYHGTGSYSNVKVLIDDDVSVDPDL